VGFVDRETEARSCWAWAGAARLTSLLPRQPYGSSTFSMVWQRAGQVDGEKRAEMGMLRGFQNKAPVTAQLPAGPPPSPRVTSLEQEQPESNGLPSQPGCPALELPQQSHLQVEGQRGQNC